MASENRDIKLSYKADISNLQRQLAEIPGITEKEAKEMAKALDRQLRKAETAAKRAATASRKEWQQFEQTIRDAGEANKEFADQTGETNSILAGMAGTLDMINPALGDAARTAGELSGGIEAVAKATFKLNPIMLAVGAAVAAAAAAYFYFTNEAEAAEEATEDAAKEAEKAAKIYETLEKALQRVSDEWAVYTGELTDLDVKQRQAARTLTDQHAPAIGLHTEKLAELKEEMSALEGADDGRTKNLREQLATMGDATAEQRKLTKAIKEEEKAIAALGEQRETAIHRAQVLIAEKELERIERDRAKKATGRATKTTKDATKAEKERAEVILTSASAMGEMEARETARLGAQEQLSALIKSTNADQLSGVDEILEKQDDRIRQIEALEMAHQDLFGVQEAINAARARGERDIQALQNETAEERHDQIADMMDEYNAALKEQSEIMRAGQVEFFANSAEAFATFSELSADAQGKWSIRLFRLSQAAALGEIAMNTAEAATKATAQLGIFAPPAIAAIVALGAAQAAVVASETPPSFHAGMAPDERNARLLQGEGVLSRQGVASAGGAQAVRDLNSGQGSSGQIVVQNVYRHRVFDSFVQDNLNRAGPLRSALKRGSGRVGHK